MRIRPAARSASSSAAAMRHGHARLGCGQTGSLPHGQHKSENLFPETG